MAEEFPKHWDQPTLLEQQPRLSEEELRKWLFPNFPNEQQISRFFDALGRAVTVWQHVETSLYEIFERALAPQSPGACGAAFHAIQSFHSKLSATNSAVRFRLSDRTDLLEEWEEIYGDAVKKAQRRNQFVHFVTYMMFNEKNDDEKIRLEPLIHDYRYTNPKPKFKMSEIRNITDRFVVLSENMRKFKWKLPDLSASQSQNQGTPP